MGDLKGILAIINEDYPCQACAMRNACAEQYLACRAFARYVCGGNWGEARREPTRAIFSEVFCDG